MSAPQGVHTDAGADSGELQRAAAYLSRVAEPASVPLWLYVHEHGYLAAADQIRAGQAPAAVSACTESRRLSADPDADLAAAERNDIRLITPVDDEWPHFAFAALNAAADRRAAQWYAGYRSRPGRGELIPPLALWVRGNAELATVGTHSVAMVGSRAASAYGEQIAAEFAYGLARREVTVVSGGAYGIDAAAHRGALAADGISIIVSAGGLDRPYPSGNHGLYDRSAERGLLISERPPGSAPHRQRFLSRNRIIAALGVVTLVVEAGARSGALNSAGYARDLGRPVLAVPGPITSAMSAGCHRLLQRLDDPAHLVTSVADVLEFCPSPAARSATDPGWTSQSAGSSDLDPNAGGQARTGLGGPAGYDSLDPVARTVLDGLPARAAVTEAELARLSGQPMEQVIAALPLLLNLGLVSASREGYRLLRSR